MRIQTTFKFISGATALSLLLACSGGGSSSGASSNPASALSYSNPATSTTNWTLVKNNAASTNTHLVLDLFPPADGRSGFGMGFTITAPAGLSWSNVVGGDTQPIHAVPGVYNLGTGTQLIKAVSKNGDLIAGIYQKGLATTPAPHSAGAIASIALDLASGAQKTASASLTVKTSQELQASGMQTITIVPGTIALQ